MSLGRVLTAMITPMKADGSVNFDDAARLARHLAACGSDGLVVAGSTGEAPALSFEEKIELFRTVREAVGSETVVIAGTGTNVTAVSVELTQAAERIGVDGVMLVVPYYNKPTQEGIYRHFRTVAESTSLPVMLYNVPGRTGQRMLPETVQRLAQDVPNIVALKEAGADLEQAAWIRRLTPERFALYSGDDVLTLPMLAVGARGVVSVASHLVGERIQAMIRHFEQGEVSEALRIHLELLPVFKAMFITTNPIPVKKAVELMGFDAGPLRLPLCEATAEEVAAIRRVLESLALL